MENKTAFIINGTVKNKHKIVAEIETTFQNLTYKIFISEKVNHITELVKKCCEEGFTNIIIGGGDGSLNEGLNGIMQANAFSSARLGIFPLGSGNDFIKTSKSPKSLELLKNIIEKNKFDWIDIGFAKYQDENNKPTSRYFLNITDLGLGGVAVKKLQHKLSFLSPSMNYNLVIGSTFLTYKKVEIASKSESFEYTGKIMSFVVANGQYFGSGMGVAPDASIQDGLFEIVVMGDINIWDYIKNLSNVKASRKINHSEVKYYKAKQLSVRSIDSSPLPIDMDGEFVGYSPIDFECLHKKIMFII